VHGPGPRAERLMRPLSTRESAETDMPLRTVTRRAVLGASRAPVLVMGLAPRQRLLPDAT